MNGSRIINRVRELRQLRDGMTQQDLAKECGVTRQTIIALERGTYFPSLDLAFRLAQTFGVAIEDVFQWEPNTPKKT